MKNLFLVINMQRTRAIVMKIVSISDYDPGLTYTSLFHALYFIYVGSSDIGSIGVYFVLTAISQITGSFNEDSKKCLRRRRY